jgi:hypothetical protein
VPEKIPYTHWAYFSDEASARACAADLPDYITRVNEVAGEHRWLLLAGHDIEVADLPQWHVALEEIVERHGGEYDGGEATFDHGVPVADPMLTDHNDQGK